MEKNAGYTIQHTVLFDNGSGFALGENPKAPAPFVTWQFNDDFGRRDYFWGHYHADRATAEQDLSARVSDYKRLYKVQEVKPIAQQMKETAKLAEADRGAHSPKKNSPNRGER